MIKIVKEFNTYEEYLDLQKTKALDPIKWAKLLSTLKEVTKKFHGVFSPYEGHIKQGLGLCLGARAGGEVLCLREMGLDCIGLDLVPQGDIVIEGDVHDLQFKDDTFDFIYTNIFDHVLYPDKFISESIRVLKEGGTMLLQLQLGEDTDDFGVLEVHCPEEVRNLLAKHNNIKILASEVPENKTPTNHGLNWNILIRKEKVNA